MKLKLTDFAPFVLPFILAGVIRALFYFCGVDYSDEAAAATARISLLLGLVCGALVTIAGRIYD